MHAERRAADGRAGRDKMAFVMQRLIGCDAAGSGRHAEGEAVGFGDGAAEVGELFELRPGGVCGDGLEFGAELG